MAEADRPRLPDRVLHPETEEDHRERDRLIFVYRGRDLTWTNIAAEFGINEKTARQAAARYRQRERLDILDRETATELVHEMLAGYEQRLERLAAIEGVAKNGAAAVGAIRTSIEIYKQRQQLLSELGVLPKDLGQFNVERDLMAVAHQIVGVLEDDGVAEETQLKILRIVSPSQADFELESGSAGDEAEVVEAEVVS